MAILLTVPNDHVGISITKENRLTRTKLMNMGDLNDLCSWKSCRRLCDSLY
jgi:hypothetical protein